MPYPIRRGTGTGALTPTQEATLLYFQYNEATDKLEASKSIETILASIFLGGQHKVTSGGENIFVKNLTSDINYSAAWNGIKDQSIPANQDASGLIQMTSRVHTDLLEAVEVDGPISATNITTYQGDATFSENTTLFGVRFRLGQSLDVGNILRYSLYIGTDDTGIKIYEQEDVIDTPFTSGDFYDFWYDSPASVFGGSTLYAEITVETAQNSGVFSILDVYATDADPNERYTIAQLRGFSDLDTLDVRDYSQRQLIRSGIKGNFFVFALGGETQIQVNAFDAEGCETYFRTDLAPDGRDGFSVRFPTQVVNVPVGPLNATQIYHVFVDDNGDLGTSLTKTALNSTTQVHLFSYTAINGQVIPEGIITNPYLAYSDKTYQGVLETEGIQTSGFNVESADAGDLSLRRDAYNLISNGGNYINSVTNPHNREFLAEDPMLWTYMFSSITAPPTTGTETQLDPTQWDNAGTLELIGGAPERSTVQTMLITRTGQEVILYGQFVYDKYEDAVQAALNGSAEPTLPAGLLDAKIVAQFAMRQDATLSVNADQVSIIIAPQAGGGSGQLPENTSFLDADFELINAVDNTKKAKFDLSEVPTGTSNTYGLPEAGGTLTVNRPIVTITAGTSITIDAPKYNQDTVYIISAPNDFTVFMSDEVAKQGARISFIKTTSNLLTVSPLGFLRINGSGGVRRYYGQNNLTDLYQITAGGGNQWTVDEEEQVVAFTKFDPSKLTNGEVTYRDNGLGMRVFRTGTGTFQVESDGTTLESTPSNWAVRAAAGEGAYMQVEFMIAGLTGASVALENWSSAAGPVTGNLGSVTLFIRNTSNGNLTDVTNTNGHVYIAYKEVR